MPVKIIQLGDGKTAKVDEARFMAFDSLSGSLKNIINQGMVKDAGEAMAFLVSQLAHTESQTFEKIYTPLQYEQLIPISDEAGEWADSVRFEVYDYAGQGRRTSGKGRDINKVDVAYADKSFPIYNGDIGYDYNQEELRRAAFLKKPLPSRKAAAALEGFRRHMNIVGLTGEGAVTGLFNNALVPQGNAPVGAWLTGPKTPAQILGDINALIQLIWTNTAFSDMTTDIVMPPSNYAYISSTPRSDNSDKTILQYVKENNIAKTERGSEINFMPGYNLETAGVNGTKRMMGYVKSPLRLIMHIPLPLRFLAPQMVGLAVDIPGEYKYSGVEFRYPKSGYYMDGL